MTQNLYVASEGIENIMRYGENAEDTNPLTDRFITPTHLRCHFQMATSSARQYSICYQTVLRRLRQARKPIRPRRPYVVQVLTARHWAACLQWAQRHFRWGR